MVSVRMRKQPKINDVGAEVLLHVLDERLAALWKPASMTICTYEPVTGWVKADGDRVARRSPSPTGRKSNSVHRGDFPKPSVAARPCSYDHTVRSYAYVPDGNGDDHTTRRSTERRGPAMSFPRWGARM